MPVTLFMVAPPRHRLGRDGASEHRWFGGTRAPTVFRGPAFRNVNDHWWDMP